MNSNTGFDVASFLLGYATTKTRNMFDAGTYTEKRPEWSLYVQDDFRVSSKLTLNLGLRYDIYVPWVEIEDRQSNFDEDTGTFVVASDNATIQGVNVGRYLQTYSKGDLAPRVGFAYDVRGTGRTLVRGGVGVFWNYTPGGTSSSKAQNPPFLQSTALTAAPNTNFSNDPKMLVSAGLPDPPGVDPSRPAAGQTRSIFDIDFRDAYTVNWNLNVQQQFGQNYMVELAYVGAHGRQYLLKGDPNEAPADGRRDQLEHPAAVRHDLLRRCARSGRCRARASWTTTASSPSCSGASRTASRCWPRTPWRTRRTTTRTTTAR